MLLRERPLPLRELCWAWVLPNSACVAVFSLLARARPLSILAAALAAPVTALLPRVDAGSCAALVEAGLRRPSVADCEGLSRIASLQDWRENRFTRVLIVGFAASVGATLGALVGTVAVISLF
jgi:pheromone shutdown protein TraB